ncbi:S8 family serine peptidase [Bacillus sp. FJAT-49732]|uniref:S8 family serine peptidase n=1 Tax=Lederbergia citrisecunda TaxID=2833583 RepID=A0A942TPR0_9BACI|nr:S8 family serine peptidase [Lederbergia citrisecunda]MBS4200622.1 S8 family serine peptidase [Lederbergia citrisecunda]
MRFRVSIFSFIFLSFFMFFSVASAEELQVEPKISKFSTHSLFDEKRDYDKDELVIKFKSSITTSQKQKILQSFSGTETSSLADGKFSLVTFQDERDPIKIAEELLKHKEVEFVEPNYKVKTEYTPSDPNYKNQWYLKKIQMPKAWDITKGSSQITVAVIDSGVQINHPDLKGKIVFPYNVVTRGKNFTPDAHGTHVAGIIAASMNKTGVAGIAPNVKIMPINVFKGENADMYDVAVAVVYAADHGANVINMSLGSESYSYVLDYAAEYAKSEGVVLIAAAGNSDSYWETYPAALPSVLGISATNKNDNITDFSNYGTYIDLAAPGQDIYSTYTGSSYKNMSGTSMASPVVSGVAALILSKNPLLSADQVYNILKNSSVDLGSKGWDHFYGYGRVDAYKALQKTSAPISNINLNTNFTVDGSKKNTFSLSVHKGAKLSLYVQDSKGKTVKTLIKSKVWNQSKASASWDGKQDNGTYAPTGTYKVIAKLTNGKETVSKTNTFKLTNKIKIAVKMNSSAAFSPKVTSKLTVSYYLNKSGKVTAKIYDNKNKLIKTLLNNSATSAGDRKLTWDGKNSKGQLVKDGNYKLVVSAMDSAKVKSNDATMSIKVDTVKPTATISLLTSPYKIDGKSKPVLKVTVKEKVNMTTYVMTEKGSKIKQLTNNKSYNPGAITLNWNGKNDKGINVAEGKYYILVEVKDAVGNKLSTKSKLFVLQDWLKPTIQATQNLYYSASGNTSYEYTSSKAGNVTVQILKDGKIVRTVQSGISIAAGTNKFVVDGKDQAGNVLADGVYQYKITVLDKYNNSGSYTGNLTVALTKVTIEYPTVVEYDDSYYAEYASEVFYKLSHAASVTIEIFDSYNYKVRTIVKSSSLKAGINKFKWDGYDDDGDYADYYYDYPFRYVITAKNAGGNVTTVQGKITNEENPKWLVSHSYSFTQSYENYWENTALNLNIKVNEPLDLKLLVYNDSYSQTLLYSKSYKLLNGTNNLTYNKVNTDDLYYILQYQDKLGNKYHYEIDESDDYYNSYSMKNTDKSLSNKVPSIRRSSK